VPGVDGHVADEPLSGGICFHDFGAATDKHDGDGGEAAGGTNEQAKGNAWPLQEIPHLMLGDSLQISQYIVGNERQYCLVRMENSLASSFEPGEMTIPTTHPMARPKVAAATL